MNTTKQDHIGMGVKRLNMKTIKTMIEVKIETGKNKKHCGRGRI